MEASDLHYRTEKKMLLAVSLLSSIAQSRVGQWLRAMSMQQRRVVRISSR